MGVVVDDVRRSWCSDEAAGYVRVGPPSETIDDDAVGKLLQVRVSCNIYIYIYVLYIYVMMCLPPQAPPSGLRCFSR